MPSIVMNDGETLCHFDEQDAPLLSKYNWYLHKVGNKVYARGYIRGDRKSGLVYMHRILMNTAREVDHINGDGLDNRRGNLRPCTRSQNNINRPATKGYYFERKSGKFVAEIRYRNKKYTLGRHSTKERARAAYVNRATELYGYFAPEA